MKVIDIHHESEYDLIHCLICAVPSLDEDSNVVDCGHLVLIGMNITDEIDEEPLFDKYQLQKKYMKNKTKHNSFFDFLDSYLDDSFIYVKLIDVTMVNGLLYSYNLYEYKKPKTN